MFNFRLWATFIVAISISGLVAAEPSPQAEASITVDKASNPQFNIQPVDDHWRESLPRNAEEATKAYMGRLSPEVVARANSYFEGGYWLQLWNFLMGLAISLVLLGRERSSQVRDWAQRVGKKAFLRDAIYGGFFAVSSWLLSLPLTVYQGYFREHSYGMATQTFGPWLGEQLIGLAVTTVMTAFSVGVLYAVIRRAGERWWLWGTVTSVGLLTLMMLIGPVWIDPLFNT